jgi:uncharacterized protein with HEPN domain
MKGQKLLDKDRLQHIAEAIIEVESYLSAYDYEMFMQDSRTRFATIKQLEIIGEAANHLSKEIKEKYPHVEWASIIRFRNISVHEYFGINLKIVWTISKDEIHSLKTQINHILQIEGNT